MPTHLSSMFARRHPTPVQYPDLVAPTAHRRGHFPLRRRLNRLVPEQSPFIKVTFCRESADFQWPRLNHGTKSFYWYGKISEHLITSLSEASVLRSWNAGSFEKRDTFRRRARVVKGADCKSALRRFESGRRLFLFTVKRAETSGRRYARITTTRFTSC